MTSLLFALLNGKLIMESLCQLVLLSFFLWLYNKYVMCVHHNNFMQIKGIYIVSSFLNITNNAALSICIHTSLKCGALLQIPISEDVKSKHTYILNFNKHCLTASQNSWYDAHSSEKNQFSGLLSSRWYFSI